MYEALVETVVETCSMRTCSGGLYRNVSILLYLVIVQCGSVMASKRQQRETSLNVGFCLVLLGLTFSSRDKKEAFIPRLSCVRHLLYLPQQKT